eukprot:40284-Eustigmatos_ZCMA.PRE.1
MHIKAQFRRRGTFRDGGSTAQPFSLPQLLCRHKRRSDPPPSPSSKDFSFLTVDCWQVAGNSFRASGPAQDWTKRFARPHFDQPSTSCAGGTKL